MTEQPDSDELSETLSFCERTLQYHFRDRELLLRCLTHASVAKIRLESNERLEFLGDAVLGAIVCHLLFTMYPDKTEGELTRVKSVVVMPSDAPLPKRQRTAAFGAEVVLYDRDTEDRAAIARRICAERGATLVPPFDDPKIIAGQGTLGLEVMEDLARLGVKPDIAIVGCSGGGLIAGTSLALKAKAPGIRIVAAEPEGFDDTLRSFKSGQRERNPRMSGTICDALMTETPGVITWEINRKLVGEGVAASDQEVGRAVAFAFREMKLVVEPGGAIGLAAMLAGKVDIKGKVVIGVLSGGNIDPDLYYKLLTA